jgi:hypothetical protein
MNFVECNVYILLLALDTYLLFSTFQVNSDLKKTTNVIYTSIEMIFSNATFFYQRRIN